MIGLMICCVLLCSGVQAEEQSSQSQSAKNGKHKIESMCAKVKNSMTTKGTIQGYFNCLKQKKEWESFLSDDMIFTSFTSPIKQVTGKDAYLESTKRFYSMIISVEVKDLLIENDKACALTSYKLQPPKGNTFVSDVAEIFTVKNGKIDSLAIYFDTSPFPK